MPGTNHPFLSKLCNTDLGDVKTKPGRSSAETNGGGFEDGQNHVIFKYTMLKKEPAALAVGE